MSNSISINNFKKVAAVATFLATAACLVPDSAEARAIARASGESNCDKIAFTLDTDVQGSSGDKPDTFLFPEAVIDSDFTLYKLHGECTDGDIESSFKFNSGSLTASLIQESDQSLLYIFDPGNNPFPGGNDQDNIEKLRDSFNNGVKYEALLLGTNSTLRELAYLKLEFFVPSIKPSSPLSEFEKQLENTFLLYSVLDKDKKPITATNRFNERVMHKSTVNRCKWLDGNVLDDRCLKVIPESSTTGSLLGLGALGAMLLVKRSKYLR